MKLSSGGASESLKCLKRLGTADRCSAWSGGRTPVGSKQIVDFGGDLGWVAVPFVFPVTVDFPIRAGQRVSILPAPQKNRLVGLVDELVRPVMGRHGNE